MGAHTSAKEGANREPSTAGVIQAGNQLFRIVLDDVPVPAQGVRGPVERDIDVPVSVWRPSCQDRAVATSDWAA